jgi:hypothetical protein
MFSFCSIIQSLMHLPTAIDHDKQALLRIVAGLFALLGLRGNQPDGQPGSIAPQRIGRALHGMIGFVLRPAESAVRRLIVLVSLTLQAKPATVRPMPPSLPEALAGSRKGRAPLAFRLFDPRLRLVIRACKAPAKTRAMPRITFFGDGEVRTLSLGGATPEKRDSEGLIASTTLLRRLEALKFALENLPRQARRLARALQRRQKVPGLKMQGAIRPGHPPGHRARRSHEIDDILRRCHWLAREALPVSFQNKLPNTS